jgi:4-alpha-glucanotransferase
VGAPARDLVDWLARAGQSVWQILPLVAVDEGGSPYNGLSAMAGNPLLIDPAALREEGLLDDRELEGAPPMEGHVDFAALVPWKDGLLQRAHRRLRDGGHPALRRALEEYRERHRDWLEDYALVRALRERHRGVPWTEWPPELRDRHPAALEAARREDAEEVERRAFLQLLFDRQWSRLREHARARGVRIMGDLPIFVAHDSADVWAHRELFSLDETGRPRVVSGVPPDYFSESGQRWGNPLYRWDVMREHGYEWWTARIRRTLEWVDLLRVDHFRGFEAYWEIPAEEETARNGEWRKGPGAELFRALGARLGELPLVAEDLGLITPEVEALRDELGFPGMRVVQFAFDGDPENPHLPDNYPRTVVAYPGTHDNDTTAGWWRSASEEERAAALAKAGPGGEPIHWRLLRAVLRSRADLAVVPAQDLLGLGSEARMNTPGTPAGNWSWRLAPGLLTPELAARLLGETRAAGRLREAAAEHSSSHPQGIP